LFFLKFFRNIFKFVIIFNVCNAVRERIPLFNGPAKKNCMPGVRSWSLVVEKAFNYRINFLVGLKIDIIENNVLLESENELSSSFRYQNSFRSRVSIHWESNKYSLVLLLMSKIATQKSNTKV
jgi:hypothetical protein